MAAATCAPGRRGRPTHRARSRRPRPPRPPRRCRPRPTAPRRRPPPGTRCRSPPAPGPPSGSGSTWRTRRRSRTASGRSASGTRPSSRTGAPDRRTSRSSRMRSRPVPAMATVRSGWPGASRAAASIRVSIPLRGTRRLTLTTSRPPAGRPRRARAAARSMAASGRNRVGVDARRHLHDPGNDACSPTARRASASG